MSGTKTTLGNLTETAKELTIEEKLKTVADKVLLNSYYFYVKDCIKNNVEVMIGSDWYEKVYKKQF